MYWTATPEQGPWVAGINAAALQAEARLRAPCPDTGRDRPPAHSQCRAAFEFGGRAGFQARHIKAACSALLLALSYREGCAVFVAASIRVSETQTTRPALPRNPRLRPPTSSFYSTLLPNRIHTKCRTISNLVFSTRQFSGGSVSAAESACGTGASHTLLSQIHLPKGLR